MTIPKALSLLFSTTLFFTLLGGGVGWYLGQFHPSYYRFVFRGAEDPEFDSVAVGVGQGLTQGITAGAIIGMVLLIVMVWQAVKTDGQHSDRHRRHLT